MYAQRPNIDLDSMIDKGSALSKPRAPSTVPFISAPIRKAPVKMTGNKQNLINPGNQWGPGQLKINTNFDDKQLLMPEQNVKKPLISPVRNPFKTQIDHMYQQQKRNVVPSRPQRAPTPIANCANHPNKPAEFNIDIEDQCFAYCSRCAAQLASQGFEVRKLDPQTVKKGDNTRQTQGQSSNLPMYPQYQGNPMYQLILQFLTELTQTQNHHLQNMQRLTQIQQNYTTQIQNTKFFYVELISFIEQMRDDHISDLVEENRRHSQIADIEHDYLRENLDQINNIRKDIQENLEIIVQKLEEEDLRYNLNYYRQKLQVYQHKVQEQEEFFQKVIYFGNEQYQEKLARVQDFLMEVWNTENSSNQPQPIQAQTYVTNQPFNQAQNYMQAQNYSQPQNYSQQQKGQNRPIMPSREVQNVNRQNAQTLPKPQPYQQQFQQYQQPVQQAQIPSGVPNLGKRQSNPLQTAAENETKTTAFRKLFEEDEDQVMAETSPQFKKI